MWKLLWLATVTYPQGKDLYDAVLLAEHTTVDRALIRQLRRPEPGAEADTFTAECPAITGAAEQWIRRLALALDVA